jgi:hypothetical protein
MILRPIQEEPPDASSPGSDRDLRSSGTGDRKNLPPMRLAQSYALIDFGEFRHGAAVESQEGLPR